MSDEQTPYRFVCTICGRSWKDGQEVDSRFLESQTIDQAKEDVITLFAVYRNANNQDWQRVARLIEPAIDALIAAVRRSGEPTR